MHPEIIFENKDVMVINKPEGLIVHDGGHIKEDTVVSWFLERVPEAKGVGEPGMSSKGEVLERSGVVHRLDKETSGVMILAKNQESFLHLKKQFHDRLVKKEYHAFVYGAVRDKFGTINRPIGRSPKNFRLRYARQGAKGTIRPSLTHFECLKTGQYTEEQFSYLSLKPKTGRMHQLRVHLEAIGRPIVGDTLYGKEKSLRSSNLEMRRLALHAYELHIELEDGEVSRFVAPLPRSFEEALERLG